MKYYFNKNTNKVHAFEEDGSQDHLLGDHLVLMNKEQINAHINPSVSVKDQLTIQIATLERTITPRRLREAVLGIDNGWLSNMEEKITALRNQIK
jgi:hypothetical protein